MVVFGQRSIFDVPTAVIGLLSLGVLWCFKVQESIVAAARGWIDGMDQPDAERIVAFYRAHVDRGPEDAL